ncbi:MAG: RHS repeat-associated core domain-containing protein, partial [Bacteroidota bacterium]
TYYIYDIRGNLSCILPPEAVRQITILSPSAWFGKSDADKEAFLSQWASRFSYDQRKRMIADHRPGIDSTLYVYDRRDRLVMKQDGNLRQRGKWMVNKFDALNRIVVTAIYTPASSTGRLAMQQQLSTTSFAEKFDGSTALHGYTNTIFPTTGLEVMSVDYFDNYDFLRLPGTGLDYVHEAITATVGTYTYRQDTLAFKRVTGMKTGSRQLVLNGKSTPDMIRSVNWYDRYGRLAQHITDVYAGSSVIGTRRTTTVYDFTGNVLRAVTTHLPGTASALAVDRKMTWDISGRPLRLSQKTGAFPEVIISDRKYDEAGRLKLLQLHSTDGGLTFRQSLDHRYNVRGWLLGVNDARLAYDSTGDYFGYNLLYEQPVAGIGNTPRFDGTPSAMRWSANLGQSAEQERAWRFSYDPMNRLRDATYLSLRGTWSGGNANRESITSRDHNGNTKALRRYDAAGVLSDDLQLTYAGDRLQTVTESGDRTKGFVQPQVPSSAAYSYDPNGNLIADADRGVVSVTYDPFGQPAEVLMSSGVRQRIIRDAAGNKLRQEVVAASGQLTGATDYAGEFIYTDGALTHVLHPEGRTMVQTNEYQYSIKDHVGNVRLSFSSLAPVETAQVGYESANATAEAAQFLRYSNARRIYSSLFDRTNGTTAGYSQRLNGSADEKYGIARSLAVMPGDVITAEVYAKYADANQSNWTGAFNTLMGQIASATTGVVVDGGQYAGSTASFPFSAIDNTAGSTGTGPKAYLNWLVFDQEYRLITAASGYARMTTLGREYGQDGIFERLASPSIRITEPGFVYIYLSNGELTPVDVFFDDFRVTQSKSPILQMDDYQPFGLTINSASRENSLPSPYRFNGMEGSPASTTGWLWPSRYRAYDPFTGRFLQPDPVVKDHESGYAWNTGNPILFADPTGADSLQRARAVDMARRYRSMNPGDSFPLPGEQVRGLPGQTVDCSGMVSRCIIQAGEDDPYRNTQGSGVRRIVMNSERIGDRDHMDRVQTGNIVTLNNTRNARLNPNRNLSHVGIITDIRRDEEGRVVTLKMIDSGGRPGSGKSGPRESVLIENGQNRFWGQRITGFYKWDKIPDEKQGTLAKPYKFDIRKEKP